MGFSVLTGRAAGGVAGGLQGKGPGGCPALRTGGAVLPRGPSRRAAWGFTLLEAVIAMGLMASVFLSLPPLLVVLERIEQDTLLRAAALLCAQEKMEELKCRSARGPLPAGEAEEDPPPGPYGRMQRRWEVRSVSGTPGLARVATECSCPYREMQVRQRIETMMWVAE